VTEFTSKRRLMTVPRGNQSVGARLGSVTHSADQRFGKSWGENEGMRTCMQKQVSPACTSGGPDHSCPAQGPQPIHHDNPTLYPRHPLPTKAHPPAHAAFSQLALQRFSQLTTSCWRHQPLAYCAQPLPKTIATMTAQVLSRGAAGSCRAAGTFVEIVEPVEGA
jgi:hypothetical protein